MRTNKLARAALAAIVASSVAFTTISSVAVDSQAVGDFSIHDDETVYATARANGAIRDVIVVDWLQVRGDGTCDVVDPGSVTAAEALEDDIEPVLDSNGVRWSLDVDGRRDFFYRAETNQELPVEVNVEYRLNGVTTNPTEVAGASGHLRIDVTVTNRLERSSVSSYEDSNGIARSKETTYCLPLLAPVKIDVDGTRFTNIEGDADIVSVSGSTRSHTFMTFPQPGATVTIEMDGTDIELDPIIVSVFPKMAGEPDFSVTDGLGELRDGLDGLTQLSEGHYQVLDGVVQGMEESDMSGLTGVSAGFEQLASGMDELQAGTEGLGALTEGHIAYINALIAGLQAQDVSQIAQIPDGLSQLTDGVADIKTGIDGLIQLLDGQILFLDGLAASNTTLTADADDLAAAASSDATLSPMADDLAAGLAAQGDMIAALRDGDDAMGLPYGLADTRSQLATISAGLGQTLGGMQTLTDGAQALYGLPDQFAQLEAALVTLRDGGTLSGTAMPGLVATRDGLGGITGGLGEAGSGVRTAADSLAELEDLPAMLGELQSTLLALKDGGNLAGTDLPGISTTVEGLRAAADGLTEGMDAAEYGKVVIQEMKDDAAAYDTFLGKPEGATGGVRFVIKLDGIEKPAEE